MRALAWDPGRAMHEPAVMDEVNSDLERMSAEERVRWAVANLPGEPALSSSFGAQAAVSLHMVTRQLPSLPVVLVDTGYLFPATYRFVDDLVERLELNLKVFQPRVSPAWLEARHGRLWEQGLDGIDRYNEVRKTEPMQRALRELDVNTWFAGLRRDQASARLLIVPPPGLVDLGKSDRGGRNEDGQGHADLGPVELQVRRQQARRSTAEQRASKNLREDLREAGYDLGLTVSRRTFRLQGKRYCRRLAGKRPNKWWSW